MLEIVAAGLKDLVDKVVFVGGATAILQMDSEAAPEPRPTEDVDCVVGVKTRHAFLKLEKQLRELGFQHDKSAEVPICRWKFQGVAVDVMPLEPSLLGFSNEWYEVGMALREERMLPNGQRIFILSLPYFLASKLVAFKSRGEADIRFDPDLEDILLVLDGNTNPLERIRMGKDNVVAFISQTFRELLHHPLMPDTLEGALQREGPERRIRMQLLMREISVL